eukprot:Plantae.Rhodophyta-Palmaria_palmata.ctg6429.p1 GENE.Plantae.Rhodophyta-Palmaria_palmata.ctg6429~~Plantae.Rhodophyta-Palmaria_palmata.ctg6429.p1  ORF type:complete len:260 (-),score=19.99 Plantae.Rhodophyta-Palmaria_palmata.ctg6429:104-883(-)
MSDFITGLICSVCSKRKSESAECKLFCCSRCNDQSYCSKACQKIDWKEHKNECAYLSSAFAFARDLHPEPELFFKCRREFVRRISASVELCAILSLLLPTQKVASTTGLKFKCFWRPYAPQSQQMYIDSVNTEALSVGSFKKATEIAARLQKTGFSRAMCEFNFYNAEDLDGKVHPNCTYSTFHTSMFAAQDNGVRPADTVAVNELKKSLSRVAKIIRDYPSTGSITADLKKNQDLFIVTVLKALNEKHMKHLHKKWNR